jgi:hypothetical protein
MSSNRLKFDRCEYRQSLLQSVSPLNYVLDPVKFEHCNKCRPELGLVGGTAVSHINGNLVDLENDLRGQNRPGTRCPNYKYLPSDGHTIQGKEYIKPVEHPVIDTRMNHLPTCQFIHYPEIPNVPLPVPQRQCENVSRRVL